MQINKEFEKFAVKGQGINSHTLNDFQKKRLQI